MPVSIDSRDRKLLLVGGAVMALLTAGLALLGTAPSEPEGQIPSTYLAGPGGARAAYLLLRELHYPVSRWERPLNELPEKAGNRVLILADPLQSPARAEREALGRFVSEGGQVLFTGTRIESFFPEAKLEPTSPGKSGKSFRAILPSNYTRGAEKITMEAAATWRSASEDALPLYGEPRAPVVVSWRIGKGRVLWWAAATPLTNAGLAREGNLNLFLDAMHSPLPGWGGPAQIYWDEYFHGQQTSLWNYVERTPIPWGLLQLALLALLIFFSYGRRSGPVVLPAVVSRLAPLEFVDTLGGLYKRAQAEPAVVALVYERFRLTLSRQLRLSRAVEDSELAEALSSRLGWKEQGLKTTLARGAVASRAAKLSPKEALGLVRELERCQEELGPARKAAKERT